MIPQSTTSLTASMNVRRWPIEVTYIDWRTFVLKARISK